MNNAGILPYIVKDGQCKILLGKEKGKWSTFSGKQEETESFETTALREFHEETAHTFPFVTDAFFNRNAKGYMDSTTPTGKVIRLYFVNFSECTEQELSTEAFVTNRDISTSPYEKEKTELRWVELEQASSLKLRYCFYKDLVRIKNLITKIKNI